jgi:hypothetical protein
MEHLPRVYQSPTERKRIKEEVHHMLGPHAEHAFKAVADAPGAAAEEYEKEFKKKSAQLKEAFKNAKGGKKHKTAKKMRHHAKNHKMSMRKKSTKKSMRKRSHKHKKSHKKRK